MASRDQHWEEVYRTKASDAVSWYRPHLEPSLELLAGLGLSPATRLVDIGGGASTLVDDLLARGLRDITVVDLSPTALQVARERLGPAGETVHWLAGDVLAMDFPPSRFDAWHDRAVLHFLTDPADAAAYAALAARAIAPGGHAVIGGFAPSGPEKCSGLPVARRSAADLAALMGPAFELVGQREHVHETPWGAPQVFAWAVLRRRGE